MSIHFAPKRLDLHAAQHKPARFYPASVAPFPGEPTADDIEAIDLGQPIRRAICAKRPFAGGSTIGHCAGQWRRAITQFTLQAPGGLHFEDLHFAGLLTHSCSPNCEIRFDPFRIVALRAIAPGEILTIDYAATEERLYKTFRCACGEAACRGDVRGFADIAAAE